MLRNYIKIALRTLWKHRTHSAINVLGLSVAFASATLLFLTAYFEWSFDRFHADASRVFRIYFLTHKPAGDDRSSTMPYPLAPALKQEFPDVEAVTRIIDGSGLVEYAGKRFSKSVNGVDADFLRVFSFKLLQGDARTALAGLNDVVISQNMAHDVFGQQNPVGKLIRLNTSGVAKDFLVTGVLADFPDNSSISYDALIRIENDPDYIADLPHWNRGNHDVYVKLRPNASAATVESRLMAFTKKYFKQSIDELKQTGAQPDERGEVMSLRLQPLTDIHFDTLVQVEGRGTNRLYLFVLLAVGLFILLVAGINFVNLTLAQSLTRAREVGVRKSLGAQRGQLFAQLWGEALVLCGLGLALGGLLTYTLRPAFNKLVNTHLSLATLLHPFTLIAIGLGFLVITLLAGGYPAWFMARYRAVDVLKGRGPSLRLNGKKQGTSGPGWLRNALITTQFAIACGLIASTFVVISQLRYLREKPLGFNEDQVISLPIGNGVDGVSALRQVRDRLANNPNVVSVTGTQVNIGDGLDGNASRQMSGFLYNGRNVTTDWVRVDYDYLKTLGIKLLAGRDFNPAFPTDSVTSVIITESMAKQMGVKAAVGTSFKAGSDEAQKMYQIIGLIPDFHLYALRTKVEPITLHISPKTSLGYVFVRTTPQGMTLAMQSLQTLWKELAPKTEFQASFLNDNTDRWYRREERLSKLFSIAAGIAIGLSCLGLFAVALLTIEQRTKEIGVRKVLGASVSSIVALLSQDFLKLVLVAILIASPLAWYAMNSWLQDFAYKIDIKWWMFVGAGLLAIAIALATVSFQSIKAALANPVKSLRSE